MGAGGEQAGQVAGYERAHAMTIRTDQILELERVQEALVDVVLREADPAEWVRDTSDGRKERLEQKRSAVATLTIITKISSVLGFIRGQVPATTPPDPEDTGEPVKDPTRDEIRAATAEAKKILERANNGGSPKA